jgi:CRP-like cAMP-binding protein
VNPFPVDPENLLLRTMPAEDRDALTNAGEHVRLARGDLVFRADGSIPHVYFPTGGMLSVVTRMEDGSSLEAVTIGKEGATGPPLVAERSIAENVECVCQLPGEAIRVPSEVFFDLRRRSGTLVELLDRYGHSLFWQIAQTSACNRLHPIEARTSRWLLQANDRVGGSYLPLTQEFLAEMLGVRRESVSLSARLLQNAGLIAYHRGEIEVLDRPGLESTSCECYAVIRGAIDRLFPFL